MVRFVSIAVVIGAAPLANGQYYQKYSPSSPGTQNMSSQSNWGGGNWGGGNWGGGNWGGGGGNWSGGGNWGGSNYHTYPQHQHYNYNYSQPQYSGYSQPSYTPAVTYSNQPITISMPGDEPGLCGYVLSSGGGSWNYTIAPGQSQTFREDRAWKVTYDRGDGRGTRAYALTPGHYRFRHGSTGWELYRAATSTTASPQFVPPAPR